MTENAPTKPDWERIESDYRAGLLSLREIAATASITEGAIRKRAKRDGWDRDLGAKIRAKADDLVRKAEVRAEVRKQGSVTERDIVEANAARIAQVRGEHRADIARGRNLCISLLGELEEVTDNLELFQQLGELMANPEAKPDKLNEAYHKVIGIGGRVSSVKALAEAMKSFIGLEREAYGIDKDVEKPPAPESVDPTEVARRVAFIFARADQKGGA